MVRSARRHKKAIRLCCSLVHGVYANRAPTGEAMAGTRTIPLRIRGVEAGRFPREQEAGRNVDGAVHLRDTVIPRR